MVSKRESDKTGPRSIQEQPAGDIEGFSGERAERINRVLYAIANAVNVTPDLDELYQVIHHTLNDIIDVTNFFIAIVDSEKNTLYFPYFVDTVDEDFTPIIDFDTGHSLTGMVVVRRKPVLLNTRQLEERAEQEGIWGPQPLIWLGVPLIIRNKVIGVIAVQSYTDASLFSEDDLDLLTAVTDQIALAIDRKQSLDELQLSEERFRQLFEQSNDAIIIIGLQGNIVDCNYRASEMLGYDRSRLLSMSLADLHCKEDLAAAQNAFLQTIDDGHIEHETGLKTAAGIRLEVEISARIVEHKNEKTVQGIIRDVTMRKRAERQKEQLQQELERSKKMEALGLLAGGVAHDLNNILAGIISYPELLLLKYADQPALRKPLEAILESGNRAALIVADMLAIARSSASVMEHHNLHGLIEEYLCSPEFHRLESLYPGIDVTTQLAATPAVISCSSVHIKKCLMNLITNGFEAIGETGTVTLTTHLGWVSLEPEDIGLHNASVNAVVLTIHDTGSGIKDEDVEHVFEPFYTRKMMGRSGTGLGLTVVYNTMQDHGGTVTVESSVSGGTSFTLVFPLARSVHDLNYPIKKALMAEGRGEAILVVDDESQLRAITCQVLSALGYMPHAVDSGEAALHYLADHQVDLVVLDMLMEPGMNGAETYEKILSLHPAQKAVIASGFSESADVKSALALGVGAYIRKPYSMEQLSQAVRKALYPENEGNE